MSHVMLVSVRDAGGGEDQRGRRAAGERGRADRERGEQAGEAEGAMHGSFGEAAVRAAARRGAAAERGTILARRIAPMSVNKRPDPGRSRNTMCRATRRAAARPRDTVIA